MVHEIQKMAAQESEFQKEVIRLEEENLHLRMQIEQLQLETPRLRDRVQHLQKYAICSPDRLVLLLLVVNLQSNY